MIKKMLLLLVIIGMLIVNLALSTITTVSILRTCKEIKTYTEITEIWSRHGGEGDTIDKIDEELLIWIKCHNPACKAEYQISKKGYLKYVEEHSDPWMVCQKCGQSYCARAKDNEL